MIRTTRRAFLASCGVASLLWIGSAGIESAQRLASQLAYRQLQSKTPAATIATPRSTSTTTSGSGKGVASLLDQNKDAAGWLIVENTAVSYPLVQASPKNKDWYLHHNFWNQKDVAGCPFIDDRCTVSSQHVLVFGHHLGSTNLMFSSLASAWRATCFRHSGRRTSKPSISLFFALSRSVHCVSRKTANSFSDLNGRAPPKCATGSPKFLTRQIQKPKPHRKTPIKHGKS